MDAVILSIECCKEQFVMRLQFEMRLKKIYFVKYNTVKSIVFKSAILFNWKTAVGIKWLKRWNASSGKLISVNEIPDDRNFKRLWEEKR